ncbi:hypothetical protein D3C72_254810 [compost metagenome]
MSQRSVYLAVTHVTRLAKGIHSNKKGVSTDPDNWETLENMVITDNVNKRLMTMATVVIDLLNGKVIKNRFADQHSDAETFRSYVDRYQADIGAALKKWGTQDPENYKKLKGLAGPTTGASDDETTKD